MERNATIIVTGAAGFIGSCLTEMLNQQGFDNLVIADDFSREDKRQNFETRKYRAKIERDELFNWLDKSSQHIDFVFHLGARTDTAEFDYEIHRELNLEYSKKIWTYCAGKKIPLVYASSAATYGNGDLGYKDDHELVNKLQPLNPYGVSKNEFDKWAMNQPAAPAFWAGLKFFNVYGFNEAHKERMASMVFHSFHQVKATGKVRLFKSHKPEYKDGEQLRDFIYVKDIVKVCYWIMQHGIASGLYNLGTGKARSFNDLARAVFNNLNQQPEIAYTDIPADIRDKYQYFTEADMTKLRKAGYNEIFYTLEEGVADYLKQLHL